jgi:predicted PurR-regulated permease PerM
MPDSESNLWGGRGVYAVALALVFAAFLFSLREILNPFVLLLLLISLLSPFSGSRMHLLMVTSASVLTGIWILETTGFLLAPFFLSLVFAYILHPVVRKMAGPRVPRSLAIAFLSVPLLLLMTLLVLFGIPALSQQMARLVEGLPALLQQGIEWVDRLRLELARRDLPFVDEAVLLERWRTLQPEAVIEYLQTRQEAIAAQIWRGVMGAGRGLTAILTILGYVVLTPILTYYLLRDYDRVAARLADLIPISRRDRWLGFAREYDRLLARFLRGQLLAAAAVGVLTGVGLWIVGFPNALLVGVVAGIFNIVPYLGLVVSLIPALIIALFSGSILLSLGKIALVFGVVQLLDGSVIGPRIMGESVGIHPVWVILALAVSGFFFGFVGLLLAIPLAVLVKLVIERGLARYSRSSLYQRVAE